MDITVVIGAGILVLITFLEQKKTATISTKF